MIPLKRFFTSSLGKKYLMAVSGLALLGFMLTHLLANLNLYWPDSTAFNAYPHKLFSFGGWLTLAELGLAGLFLMHASLAAALTWDKRAATPPTRAAAPMGKGGASHFGFSANNMIITGAVLLIFLVIHVWQFRFGPGIAEGYVTTIDGEEARDLYRLVADTFKNEVWVAFYMFVMCFLGLHFKHALWSGLQSLGAMKPQWSDVIYGVGVGIAFAFFVGFLGIPLWFYFDIPGRL